MENKIQDAFAQIHASPKLKEDTLRFLQAERSRRSRQIERIGRIERSRRTGLTGPGRWQHAFTAVCAALALVVGIGVYHTTQTPVSYVSIDVNPSVELALNRYDRVVSATAYNDDGELILDQVNVKGTRYTDAIDTIIESSAMQPYLTDRSTLTFTVAAYNPDKEVSILNGVNSCSGCRSRGGQSYRAEISNLPTAHDNDLSLGKYTAYLTLSQYDNTITTKDCHNMTMTEIHHQIRKHQNNGNHGNSNNHNDDGNNENRHKNRQHH